MGCCEKKKPDQLIDKDSSIKLDGTAVKEATNVMNLDVKKAQDEWQWIKEG